MEIVIKTVKRESGIVTEIVTVCDWIQITFSKTAAGQIKETRESAAPPGKKLASFKLPRDDYARLKQRVEAIFSNKNGKRHPPDRQNLPLVVREVKKALEESKPYRRRVEMLARQQKLSPAKAERELFLADAKESAYRESELFYLHRSERNHFEALRQAGIKLLERGVLAVSRTDRTESKESKIQSKLADLNAAIRMQQHILDGYFNEIGKTASEMHRLDELKSLAEEIHKAIFSWKFALDPETLLGKIKELADRIARLLSRSRNPEKLGARRQAEHLAEPLDSLGRHNPGAQAARTSALLNRLADRLAELDRIIPIIARRKQALEAKRTNIYDALNEAADRLKILDKVHLSAEELSAKIGQAMHVLGQASILPYYAQGRQAAFYLKQARESAHDRPTADRLIETARRIIVDRPFDIA